MVDIGSLSDWLCNIKESMKTYFYPKTDMDILLNEKSDADHIHDDRYYTETEMNTKLNKKSDTTHTHPVDSELSNSSTNPVQNRIVKGALDDKADNNHVHTIDSSLNNSSTNPVQNKVINTALAGKANTSHTHSIGNITNLQSTLNNKADKTDLPTIDSALSSNSGNPVQNKIITNELANKASLDLVNSNNKGLMSSNDKIKLDNIADGAKATKRVPGIYISSDTDKTNQNLVTISKGTRLKVILFDQESMVNPGDFYNNVSNHQIPSTTINYTVNGINSTVSSGGTIGINLDPGTYDMHFMFGGSGNYYQIYRSIKLKIN